MGNLTLKELGRRAFETAKAKGFHDEPIDIPRALMLTVSELAEALEADRKNKRADLSAFFDKEPCEIFPFREKFEVHVKDTFEDELADGEELDVENLEKDLPDGVSTEDPVRMYLKEIGNAIDYVEADRHQRHAIRQIQGASHVGRPRRLPAMAP